MTKEVEVRYDKTANINYVQNGWEITIYPVVTKSKWDLDYFDYCYSSPKETYVATNWNDLVDILKKIER